ncbi:binfunctional sulfate adenylyltransferase subunit 1/adenylylsulfate kinase protein [Fulvimarina pelagi HTCC2506]|uniref:Bifunctional enzyme NodQ n=1 Tax=Fulvimarina pelagi HTCC2506 TaxID=314231 RepID=Q0G239_9HYPH|nr:sulfate adenylyltransferase subunit CysN [Fulvimarina pelagi]EAU41359.1 binfunctional sulfate adenylyltransferase subunit 1/adenylylsulfate kinase protein [Fulvimarina pelagi HTCC2506]
MAHALKERLPDEADTAQGSTPAALEDETYAGPAPDAAGAAVVNPQGFITPLVAPAGSLLRFITCGSVDDGKSTLIGRLLYETNAVFDDQMEALEKDSKKFGTTGGDLDFALLVDGLSAEREQGITIDVAYRYFSSENRAFIIADTPGHEQYTRNMATGASQAELAVILVDARKGILPQTRRHSFITSLVGIKSVVIAINKMDLVDFAEERFDAIKRDYEAILPQLGFTDVSYVPLSAKNGDNIVKRSPNTPWYQGETLLQRLETADPETFEAADLPFRLPVQWVNRPNLDFRGFCGTVASGTVKAGDRIVSLPSGQKSTVKAVWNADAVVDDAQTGDSITLTLNDEIDASRGDVIVRDGDDIQAVKTVEADILWMVDRPMVAGGRLIAKLGSHQTPATLRALNGSVDIHSYQVKPANALLMNEIGKVTIALDRPPVATTYAENRELGAFILIDQLTNETVALGIVTKLSQPAQPQASLTSGETASLSGFQKLKAKWLGAEASADPDIAVSLTRNRFVMSGLLIVLGVFFGLSVFTATIIGAIDFLFRPILYELLGDGREKPVATSRAESGPGYYGDGI